MIRLLTALIIVAIISGCKKEQEQQAATPMELLTDGKWLLAGFGFDDDSSGTIEDYENMIQDCQVDNTTQYFADGKGQSRDNQAVCQAPADADFEWKFIDNEKAIEISFQRYDLHKMTKTALHFIIHIPGLAAPAHVMYKKF